jgi:aminoglycoside phosphotransferase (APT) family kinase protein
MATDPARSKARSTVDAMVQADEAMPQTVAALGDPLGLGRTAEVFAHGDSEIVKLLRPGFPERLGEHEAMVSALVADAAVGAPHFVGTTRIGGRFGLVYDRLHGPSMLDRVARHPCEIDRAARRFAELHAAMHEASRTGLPDQKAEVARMIDRAGPCLPEDARTAALTRLAALPGGAAICHGDMHAGNVLVTPRVEVVIDWETASCGDPAGDVAGTLFLMRFGSTPAHVPRVQRGVIALARRRFSSTYLRHYRRLRRVDDHDIAAWRLPIFAARLGEAIDEERDVVLALVRREIDRSRPMG